MYNQSVTYLVCITKFKINLLHIFHYPKHTSFSMDWLVLYLATFTVFFENCGKGAVGMDITDSGCGDIKGCYRVPDGCYQPDNCEYFVSWRPSGNQVQFEVSVAMTDNEQWAALGLSMDPRMGEDSVTDCLVNNEKITIQMSYNIQQGENQLLNNPSLGLIEDGQEVQILNNRLECRFSRYNDPSETSPSDPELPKVFVLDGNKYNILVAKGTLDGGTSVKGYHGSDGRVASASQVDVTRDVVQIGGLPDYPLVKTHGCLMVLAWMVFASVCILLPRHFKSDWSDVKPFGDALWFQIHRAGMVATVCFHVIALIIIIVDVGGYPTLYTLPQSAHPVLGIIATVFLCVNPIMAVFRPHPDTRFRHTFNWAHFIVGSLAQIFAITALFVGTYMTRAYMDSDSKWFVLLFILNHIVVEIVLSVLNHVFGGKNEKKGDLEKFVTQVKLKVFGNPGDEVTLSEQDIDINDKTQSSNNNFWKVTQLKSAVLVLYCASTLLLAITMWVYIADASEKT